MGPVSERGEQVACGPPLPRLTRHRGPVALVLRRVSRQSGVEAFWNSRGRDRVIAVPWSVPAFLLRMPGGTPPLRRSALRSASRLLAGYGASRTWYTRARHFVGDGEGGESGNAAYDSVAGIFPAADVAGGQIPVGEIPCAGQSLRDDCGADH